MARAAMSAAVNSFGVPLLPERAIPMTVARAKDGYNGRMSAPVVPTANTD